MTHLDEGPVFSSLNFPTCEMGTRGTLPHGVPRITRDDSHKKGEAWGCQQLPPPPCMQLGEVVAQWGHSPQS